MNMNNPFVKKGVAGQWIRFITNRDIIGTLNQQYVEKILENWLQDTSDFSLIDIGCGNGNFLDFDAINRFKSYTGVDESSYLIQYAKENYENDKTTFFNSSVYDLPFKDESFDFLISMNVWYYLKNIYLAAEECSRVLKKDSHFIILTADPKKYEDFFSNRGKIMKKTKKSLTLEGKIENYRETVHLGRVEHKLWSMDEILTSFISSGFKIKKIDRCKNNRIMIFGQKE